jgi:type IV secretory pathway TraG/TraD family ATPase VirD4
VEVTQLSRDEGLLLVGGMLPYRARKIRYFVDPRFRDRAGRPPPDAPADQARELLAARANEWAAHVVSASPAPAAATGAPAGPPRTASAPAARKWARVLKSAIPVAEDSEAPKAVDSRDDVPL